MASVIARTCAGWCRVDFDWRLDDDLSTGSGLGSVQSMPREGNRKRRVLIVDDHPIVREGLRALINQQTDLETSGEAADTAQALAAMAEALPDIALVDIALGRESGLDLISAIKARHADLPILAISMHDEQLFAERALQHGANGYIMKHEATDLLLTALRQVLDGRPFVSPAVTERMLRGVSSRSPVGPRHGIERLSDRELEVFRLLGLGLSTIDIAGQLGISQKTVESHRLRLKDKLGVETSSQLVVLAARWLATTPSTPEGEELTNKRR
jgi:DNA-binding NarL/FixJ family response regulator